MPTLVRRLAVATAVSWMIALAIAFAARVGFPLELEWMEGGILHQALRFQRGEPLYPPPSPEFVPFLYTPLYAMVLGVLGFVAPLQFALGRAVSIASVVAIAFAIYVAVRREEQSRDRALVAVGLFCSSYVFTFRWLDVARPDAMFMALTLWALVGLRHADGSWRRLAVAGTCMALAFWTKQTAATFVLASGLAALWLRPRRAWAYALPIAVVDALGVWIANLSSDGWLWHYIYELHQSHAFNHERFTTKTWGMFAHAGPFALLGVAVAIASRWREREAWRTWFVARSGRVYWGFMAATGLLVSALGYATQWAEPNAFIPGATLGCVFVGVVVPVRAGPASVVLGAMTLQMWFSLAFEPLYHAIQTEGWSALPRSYARQRIDRTIPSASSRQRAADLRAELEQPSRVFALHRPWWSVLAGGEGHVGSMGVRDVADDDRRRLEAAIRQDLLAGVYDRLWFEGEPPPWLLPALRSYRVDRRLHGEQRVRPMSGWMSEAGVVTPYETDQVAWARIGPRPRPADARVIADFEAADLSGFRIEGSAFGRRGASGRMGRLPAVGPYGDERLLSSATASGRLELTGTAVSPPFEARPGQRLQLLVGTSAPSQRLGLSLSCGDEEPIAIAIPETRFALATVELEVPPRCADQALELHVIDDDPEAAIFLDDVWLF